MYWAMHGPCAAQSQQVAQSAGAVQSTPPPLDDSPPESSVTGPPLEPLSPVAFVSTVVPESVALALAPVESSPSLVPGVVIVEAVNVAFVSSPESSPPQPNRTPAIAIRRQRMAAV